jgi:hypothetical protein
VAYLDLIGKVNAKDKDILVRCACVFVVQMALWNLNIKWGKIPHQQTLKRGFYMKTGERLRAIKVHFHVQSPRVAVIKSQLIPLCLWRLKYR